MVISLVFGGIVRKCGKGNLRRRHKKNPQKINVLDKSQEVMVRDARIC